MVGEEESEGQGEQGRDQKGFEQNVTTGLLSATEWMLNLISQYYYSTFAALPWSTSLIPLGVKEMQQVFEGVTCICFSGAVYSNKVYLDSAHYLNAQRKNLLCVS